MRDEKAWKWLNENQLSYDIWEKKYRYNNESFDEWLDRVSNNNSIYKEMILAKRFLPAGRILSNRGLYKDGIKVTYSNCYVQTPPEDNIESIFDCAKEIARTFSYGGGVGIDISKLAPRGARVNNTARETSGAVSFMDLYSMVTGLIGQNGRRGALMISLDCNHPDLEEFIDIKTDLNKVTKANISVKITDDFMNAVIDNQDYELEFIREETGERITKTVDAAKVFHQLCENNWNFAEPGMLFWDNINDYNLLSNNYEFEYAGTNPCAEEPLPAGGSCLLGSINLAAFVKNPFTNKAEVNWDELLLTVRGAVGFLNEILDEGLPLHPLAKQRETVRDWRQIGLGIMGLADMLIMLGIKYGNPNAVNFCDILSHFIANNAIQKSAALAREEGVYPKYNDKVMETEFYLKNTSENTRTMVKENGLRNSQLLTIAPTGTLSTMLGISGGIEPIFSNSYTRKTESLHGEDVLYKVYTPIVEQYMKANDIIDESDLPEYFVTSADIKPEDRIAMQAAFQRHIDASISSTINLSNSATVEDVEDIYKTAWAMGLKGVTIYRAGCAREGILVEKPEETVDNPINNTECATCIDSLPRGYVIDVSDDLIGYKRKLNTGCGSIHMEVYADELTGEPQETFINIGSSGGCERNYQFISRLISTALRGGIPIESIIDQAMSIRPCTAYVSRTKTKGDTSPGTSCPSAIGRALKELQDKMSDRCFADTDDVEDEVSSGHIDPIKVTEKVKKRNTPKCPECGEEITFEGGCNICKSCGWSKCD